MWGIVGCNEEKDLSQTTYLVLNIIFWSGLIIFVLIFIGSVAFMFMADM